MPEWIEIVRERIGALGLEPEREAEIVAELSNHQEDVFEEWRRRGLSEEEAAARVLLAVSDWQELGREIQSAELEEVPMKRRIRSVWLPGLITGALAWGVFWLLETSGVRPRVFWWNHEVMMFSLPWTLTLPIIGALGAYSSRRRGGQRSELILAALFPPLVLAILFCIGLALRGILAESSIPLSTIAVGLLSWVIVPAVALLAGVLPFMRQPTR
jgi:hypothetical protein